MTTFTLFVKTNTNPEGIYYFDVTKFNPHTEKLTFNHVVRKPAMCGYREEVRHIEFDKYDNWDCEVISVNGKLRKEVPNYIKARIAK